MRRWVGCFLTCLGFIGAVHAEVVRMTLLTAPPYGMVDDAGRMSGIYPDIARALVQETGLDVQAELVPFARAANEVAKGSAQATIMMSNAFSESKAVEAVVVFFTRQVLLMRPGLEVKSPKQLAGLTIGRLNGGCQSLAEQQGESIRFHELNSQSSAVGMLALGRLDAFCSTEEGLRAEIRGQGLEDKMRGAVTTELGARPVWLMVSPGLSPDVTRRLVDGVRRLQKNGKLATIFRQYLGAEYQPQFQEKVAPATPSRSPK